MQTTLDLATSRYQAGAIIKASGRLPVGITKGHPRWKLPYQLATNVRILGAVGPGEFVEKDRDRFSVLYRRRMEGIGFQTVHDTLEGIAPDDGRLVLLCYEDVHKPGEWCHRQVFAAWWESHTGQAVPELPPDIPIQTGLFG